MINWKKPSVYAFGLILFALAPFMPVKSVERIGIYELGMVEKRLGSVKFDITHNYSGNFFRHGKINPLEIRLYRNWIDAVCEDLSSSFNEFDCVWNEAEKGKLLVTRQRVVKNLISGLSESIFGRDIEEMNYKRDMRVNIENIVGEAEVTWTEYMIIGDPKFKDICGVYLDFPELEVLDSSDGGLDGKILNNFQVLVTSAPIERIRNGNTVTVHIDELKDGCKIRVVDFCKKTESGIVIPERCRRIEILD